MTDAGGLFIYQHFADREAPDVHAQDFFGAQFGRIQVVGQLNAAGLAPAADEHLGLDHHMATQLPRNFPRPGRADGNVTFGNGHAALGKQTLRLIFVQIHFSSSFLWDDEDWDRWKAVRRTRNRRCGQGRVLGWTRPGSKNKGA